MNRSFPHRGKPFARIGGISLLTATTLLATLIAPNPARADLFISNGDSVGRYDSLTGLPINANFVSVAGATGLALGPDGNLYVASPSLFDVGSGVLRFDASSGASNGVFVSHISDPDLNNPQGIRFFGGNLYVAEATLGTVLVYDSLGNHLNTLSSPLLNTPWALTFDSSGTLYVGDANQPNVVRYAGGNFSIVNSGPPTFIVAQGLDLGPDGNLYVLNTASDPGVFKLNPNDGSSAKIVDYTTSPFFAAGLVVGPDGQLYVSGQENGEDMIRRYDTNGLGGGVFADLGFGGGAGPSFMLFTPPIPEPSVLLLASVGALGALCSLKIKRKSRAS